MSLIVEEGSGLATADSYVAVATADDHHLNYNNPAWAAATTAGKEAALRRATRYLDGAYGLKLMGSPRLADQALAWPRRGVPDVAESVIPRPVIQATAELALRALTGDLAPDRTPESDAVEEQRTTVGPVTTAIGFRDPVSLAPVYPVADQLMAPFLRNSGTRRVVRA